MMRSIKRDRLINLLKRSIKPFLVDKTEKEIISDFMMLLSNMYLHTLLTNKSLDIIKNYILKNTTTQDTIMDLLTQIETELILYDQTYVFDIVNKLQNIKYSNKILSDELISIIDEKPEILDNGLVIIYLLKLHSLELITFIINNGVKR